MQSIPNIVRDRLKATQPAANHPDANLLTAFAEQSLPAPERAAVLEHISRCGDCRDVVALALPATEAVAAASSARPARAAWLTWPVLRWGFVAAGVVTIASLGLLQIQRRSAPQMMAYKSPEVAVPTSRSQAAEPAAPAAKPAVTADRLAPSPAAGSLRSSNAPIGEHKRLASAPLPPAPAQGNAFRGVAGGSAGGNLSWGPSSPSLSQQNNSNNAQQQTSNYDVRTPTLNQPAGQAYATRKSPSASQTVEVSGAAPLPQTFTATQDAKTRDQSTDSQLQFAYAGGIAKAKLPVPPATSGQVGGYVFDLSGAVVPNARITITPSATGGPVTAVTNSQGAWLVAGLPAGNYKAQAEAPGFNPTVLAFNYDANRPATYSFKLSPGSVAETVEVAAAAQTIQAQADAASVANTITNDKIGQVPVNGRDLTQLAELAPGVAPPSPRWTINSAGGLRRSLDQGKTWQMVDVNAAPPGSAAMAVVAETSVAKQKDSEGKALRKKAATPIFRAVTATGADVWAGGSGGALYHSVDAGNTWVHVVPASGGSILTGDVVRLEFPDPQHGTITTSTPEVWTTSDAGQTWKKQ